jgi:hypothetical protein
MVVHVMLVPGMEAVSMEDVVVNPIGLTTLMQNVH